MWNFNIFLLLVLAVPTASDIDLTSRCLPFSANCDQFTECCGKNCDSFHFSQCFGGRSEWKCSCGQTAAKIAIGILIAIIIGSLVLTACCIGCIIFLICKCFMNKNQQHQPGFVIAQAPQAAQPLQAHQAAQPFQAHQAPNQYAGVQYYAPQTVRY